MVLALFCFRLSDGDGGADGAEPDVGIDDLGVRDVGLDLGRDARVLGAGATGSAGLAFLLGRVDGVEPEHVGVVLRANVSRLWTNRNVASRYPASSRRAGTYVVPDRHDEHHRNLESSIELGKPANLREAVAITKGLELGGAELGGNSATLLRNALPRRSRDLDLLSVLDEELGEFVGLETADDAVGFGQHPYALRSIVVKLT
jgi:hypothetical protein